MKGITCSFLVVNLELAIREYGFVSLALYSHGMGSWRQRLLASQLLANELFPAQQQPTFLLVIYELLLTYHFGNLQCFHLKHDLFCLVPHHVGETCCIAFTKEYVFSRDDWSLHTKESKVSTLSSLIIIRS